jgi:putative colanic acid biosynthesis acetyltransferase WcaF
LDLKQFKSDLSFRNKMLRAIWGIAWVTLFRCSPRIFHGWRRFLLRCFGSKIGNNVRIYNSVEVYYPPNLILEDGVLIGPKTDIYCVAPITINKNSMVSQYSYLCAASHDYQKSNLPLIALPIKIGEGSWICAKAFIGPGVTIGDNSLVAAASVVIKDVPNNTIVGGNPARKIKDKPKPE